MIIYISWNFIVGYHENFHYEQRLVADMLVCGFHKIYFHIRKALYIRSLCALGNHFCILIRNLIRSESESEKFITIPHQGLAQKISP